MTAHDFSQSEMLEPRFSHIAMDTNDKNPKAAVPCANPEIGTPFSPRVRPVVTELS